MEIKRQICTTWSKSQVKLLEKYGLKINEGFNSIYISENDLYFQLEPYFVEWNVFNVKGYYYSKQEIFLADYCILSGCNIGGYPMPDSDFGYINVTYDTNEYCDKCGIGGKQKDSFRLKNIPKHKIFELTWVYDELFVDTDVYKTIFQPFGISCREVIILKENKTINTLVQLIIPETTEDLDLSSYKFQICPVCGRKKYEAQAQGFFPLHKNPLPHIYKSKECFGDGGAAYKKIFISKEIRDKLIKVKVMKYHWFIPCDNNIKL